VNNQRLKYNQSQAGKGSKIPQEKIDLLNSIGFYWGKKYGEPVSWDDRFAEIEKFHRTMRSCNVPCNPNNPSPLAQWTMAQRIEYMRLKKGLSSILTMDQVDQLNTLGFKWKIPK
jgi:hypothetical protein